MSSNRTRRSPVTTAWHHALAVVEHGGIEIRTAFGGRVAARRRRLVLRSRVRDRGSSTGEPACAVVATVRRTKLLYANEHLDADERRRYPTLSET